MTKSLNVFIGEDKFAIITVPASDASKERSSRSRANLVLDGRRAAVLVRTEAR